MSNYTKSENTMTLWDESELFYRAWIPKTSWDKAIILFHRGHEHSGRLFDLVSDLELNDFAIFAWDARGNGNSPGPRDYADNFSVYARDADTFVRYISKKYAVPIKNMAVIANSVGGVIASTWIHDYAPPIRALVLAAPAFEIKLYIPFAIPLLRIAQKLGFMKYVRSYVKSKVLTHDRLEQQSFNDDPKITNSISTNILIDAYDTACRIVKDAGAIRTPTLLLMAGSDWVVKIGAQRNFFKNLSSEDKESVLYPNFYHAIFQEVERQKPICRTREFILKQFSAEHDLEFPTNADKEGFTRQEYEKLKNPSVNPIFFLSRVGMNSVCQLSNGIRLGLREGFDSGVTLDYIYKNEPSGITPLGTLIDYCYLISIGWKGIRVRKVHLNELLQKYIQIIHEKFHNVQIVDVAAGPGRYVLDAINALPELNINALLLDYKEINVLEGKKAAKEMDISCVEYRQGDAFDRKFLSRLTPTPSLAIISGLFELFPENEHITKTLNGLADVMLAGSYLLYTNQPWHPQIEFIARVLTNREGEPWIMRRRTQEEMDNLVAEAGFQKIEMLIDEWGIFTVSVAQKTL